MTEPTLYELKPNSVPHEYYCGDLPGTLQYKKDPAALKAMNTLAFPLSAADEEWSIMRITDETKLRLLPTSQKPAHWRLITAMKRTRGETIWLKGAFIHETTGKVALLTAASSAEAITGHGNRALKTHDGHYHVGFYRMGAPIVFWRQVQAVLP